jgi:hypothetical protein
MDISSHSSSYRTCNLYQSPDGKARLMPRDDNTPLYQIKEKIDLESSHFEAGDH